jgi:hypothetical protein
MLMRPAKCWSLCTKVGGWLSITKRFEWPGVPSENAVGRRFLVRANAQLSFAAACGNWISAWPVAVHIAGGDELGNHGTVTGGGTCGKKGVSGKAQSGWTSWTLAKHPSDR